jgi:hypothetical protein
VEGDGARRRTKLSGVMYMGYTSVYACALVHRVRIRLCGVLCLPQTGKYSTTCRGGRGDARVFDTQSCNFVQHVYVYILLLWRRFGLPRCPVACVGGGEGGDAQISVGAGACGAWGRACGRAADTVL